MASQPVQSSILERVYQHMDAHFEAHLNRTQAFVCQPSISADGTGMSEMAELLLGEIVAVGGQAELIATSGYPVVYGEIDNGAPKTLLVYGMYDVQPVTGEHWMVRDPFGGEIVGLPQHGPSLVSRGIFNTKGPLSAVFNTLESFAAVGASSPVNLKFVIEGEEEMGSVHLPEFIRAHHSRMGADAVLFPWYSQDSSGKPIIYLGVKGLVFLELVARGGAWGGPTVHGIHGSHAVWFHSPAWTLVQALASMMSPDQKRVLIDGFYDHVESPSAEDEILLTRLAETFDDRLPLQENEVLRYKYDLRGVELLREYLYQPMLNINGIASGHIAEGIKALLPHEASAKVDFRLVPRMRPEEVVAGIKDHLARQGYADKIEVIVRQGYPWAKTGLNNPATQAMIQTYRDLGYEPEIWPHIGASVPLYLFTEVLGLPVVTGGLGHGGRLHSPNEYATVAGMRLCEKSIAAFMANFAAQPPVGERVD